MWSPRIVIERPSDDNLVKVVWIFGVLDNMVVLNEYAYMKRETRRHKFKALETYSRLDRRQSDTPEEEVPTPEDVFDEALENARSQMKVGLWKRDFGRS